MLCFNAVAMDCEDYFKAGYQADGVYRVSPTGLGRTIGVYCEMSTGGWTRIQRRQDGSVNFERNWEETKIGFGDLMGEHWLGIYNV